MSEAPKIRILPPHLVNRIAAGEVVERPASVIKELVENALDAGATRIEVLVSAGGRTLRVADNGSGMTPEDARLAFYNHATSKIRDEADLERIDTLGFRGEALASIGSISRLTCRTRTVEADKGTRVTLDPQGEPTLAEAGCAPGTVMEVADLFYNTPARLKFLRRPQTELGHIEETVQHLALSHPEVQFVLTLGDKEAFRTSGGGDVRRALEEIFRFDRENVQMLPVAVQDETAGYRLAGYVSAPGVMKSAKRWMISFVNNRYVKCPVLSKAIESAYESLLPHGRYPVTVLFLSLPLEEVDVNVHPTKREVRYMSSNTIFSFIKQGILSSLQAAGISTYGIAPVADVSAGLPADDTFQVNLPESYGQSTTERPKPSFVSRPSPSMGGMNDIGSVGPTRPAFRPANYGTSSATDTQTALNFYQPVEAGVESIPTDETTVLPAVPSGTPSFKVVGQLFNTYILIETPQGLMVVDQHIASERTFFEVLSVNMMCEDGPPDIQQLLTGQAQPITSVQADLLTENRERFARLGFLYELRENTVTLTGWPIIYHGREPKDLFDTLLNRLEETGEMRLDLDHLIATLSCHSAVRAGDVLTPEQMRRVIEQWLACRLPWTCPHGRPIAHTISKNELNHFFDRPSLPVSAL